MTHCSEEELLLEYYGESPRPAHLDACAACAVRFRELKATLDSVALEPPERREHYGLEVWQAIRHRLPAEESWWRTLLGTRLILAAASAVVLLAVGFSAGRLWPPASPDATAQVDRTTTPGVSTARATDDDATRVLLMTVTDHFDRSDRVLAEIMNAPDGSDLTAERQSARDLVAASRLYRQTAAVSNEPAVAAVLEEVERVLLDVVHQPSRVTGADREEIRRRIDSAALLFKVRVMSNELQRRLGEPSPRADFTSTSTIG